MYTILTDSCSDLNAQIAARFAQLEVLPLWSEKIPCQVYIRNVNY